MQRRQAFVTATLAVAVCIAAACSRTASLDEQEARQVLETYRALAYTTLSEATAEARMLQVRVAALRATPGAETLEAARAQWRRARLPYSRAEALRFGHWFVDEADARLNAWPVDEGLLDYVANDYAPASIAPEARLNLVAAPDRIRLNGVPFAADVTTRNTARHLHAFGDIESHIATGYHAIEFLLWGQDRSADGPGTRPWTDYSEARCTDGESVAPERHCARRGALLATLVDILLLDLELLTAKWSANPGSFGDRLVQGDVRAGLARVLFGLVALSGQELAGERLRVARLSGAQEEEQDCFSDDTHHSLQANGEGIAAFYAGVASDAPSLAKLAARHAPALAVELDAAFASTRRALAAIAAAGERGETVDRLIASSHPQGALLDSAIAALEHQAQLLEALGPALHLGALNPAAPSP